MSVDIVIICRGVVVAKGVVSVDIVIICRRVVVVEGGCVCRHRDNL